MPSSIVSRTIVGQSAQSNPPEVDTRIQLANSNFARPHGITTWNSIRLAIRYSMLTTLSADILSNPILAIGYCSGNDVGSLVLDRYTKHFVGIYQSGSSMPFHNFNLNSNTTAPCYTGTYTFTTKISATYNPLSATSTTFVVGASAGFRCRNMVIIDLIKGSPYILRAYFQTQNDLTVNNPINGFGDPSLNDVFVNVEQPLPTYHNAYYAQLSANITVDEITNGALDNIIIAWNRTPDRVEISDIVVSRLS